MQKLILRTILFVSIFLSNLGSAQSRESLKKSIILIDNRPILIKNIDKEILDKNFIPYINIFEKHLTKKFGQQFDNCYRVIFFIDYKKPTMFVYLIPDHIDTRENWMKMNFNTRRENVYQLYFEVNSKTFSEIGYRPPLPY